MTLHLLSLVALALLAVGTVAAMFSAGPKCPCGCGNPWHQHSPLRRF